jgi:hypothetical protein
MICGGVAACAEGLPQLRSAEEVRENLSQACPGGTPDCITAQSNKLWGDPENALWIITYLSQDNRAFVDIYLRAKYGREVNGDIKVFLLGRLMMRNSVDNLPFNRQAAGRAPHRPGG